MSPKARSKSKKKTKAKKAKKVRKARKTKVKVKAKKVKKVKAKKGKTKAKASARIVAAKVKAAKEKALGRVVHFYDRISVAIIKLQSPLKVGDRICLKRGDLEILQQIESLQINHQSVGQAKKGAVVGMKVDAPVKEGAVVLAA